MQPGRYTEPPGAPAPPELDKWLAAHREQAVRLVESLGDEYWEANAEAIMARVRATHRREQSADILEPPDLGAGPQPGAGPEWIAGEQLLGDCGVIDESELDLLVTPLAEIDAAETNAAAASRTAPRAVSVEAAPLPEVPKPGARRHWWALGGALAMAASVVLWLRVAPSGVALGTNDVRIGVTQLEPTGAEAHAEPQGPNGDEPAFGDDSEVAVLPGDLPAFETKRSTHPARRVARSSRRTLREAAQPGETQAVTQPPEVLWQDNLEPAAFVEGLPPRPAMGEVLAALAAARLQAGRCLEKGSQAVADIVFGSNGRVQSLRVRGVGDPTARRCVVRAIEPARVAPFAESKHEVALPLAGQR